MRTPSTRRCSFARGRSPLLPTAPAVATLVYLRYRDAGRGRALALLVWGFLGSGGAVLVVYLRAVSYELPRALTGIETVLYDLGMFLWFVLALTVAYAVAARTQGRHTVAALLLGPVAQAAFALFTFLLVGIGLYA